MRGLKMGIFREQVQGALKLVSQLIYAYENNESASGTLQL